MRKNQTWLLYMLIPFTIGAILHFLGPLQIIYTSNPKIQNVYKSHSIEIEQAIIRKISLENARVLQNSLQMYQNMRATYLKLHQNPRQYQRVRVQNMLFTNAFELNKMKQNEYKDLQLSRSMWYIPGVQNLTQMNKVQKEIFEEWAKLEPFLILTFRNKSRIYEGFQSLKTIINKNNQTFYIQYPSSKDDRFSSLNQNLLSEKYNTTIDNYRNNNIWETVFAEDENVEICEPLLEGEQVVGVNCLEINLSKFMKVPAFLLPKFELSETEYFLVKPQYEGIDSKSDPQVIMQFQDTNFSSINFPANTTFSSPTGFINFASQQNFEFYVHRYSIGHTFYVVPISISDYRDESTIDMYLIALNHFMTEDLNIQNRETKMFLATLIPSGVWFIVSLGCTSLVLRWLLKDFSNVIQVLNQHCSHIIRGDLDLTIPDCKQGEDLTHLIDQFRILNELQQYSNPNFFDVSKPERILKYLQCFKLFKKLGYKVDKVCENIADCYESLQEFTNCVKYMQICVDLTIQDFQGKFGSIDNIFEKKTKKVKMNQQIRRMEKRLTRRLNKLIHFLYFLHVNQHNSSKQTLKLIRNYANLLQKVTFPKIINKQYLSSMLIELKLQKEENKKTRDLERLGKLLDIYAGEYKYLPDQNQDRKITFDVLESSWWLIRAQVLADKEQITEAFWHYIQSLEYDAYNPHLHFESHKKLQRMLADFGINANRLEKMHYTRNYKQRQDREYVFLIDTCRPQVNDDTLNSWKSKCRQMAENVFESFVKDEDRISIIEFCSQIKVKVSLNYKKIQPRLLRRELWASFRTRKSNSLSQPSLCLWEATKKVSHLVSQKWFIVFVKPGVEIDGQVILEIKEQVPNSEFIFVMQNPECMLHRKEGYYVLDFSYGLEDFQRILQEKQCNFFDSPVCVF